MKKLYFNQDMWSIRVVKNKEYNNLNKCIFSSKITAKDVTDVKAIFVADPFIIKNKDKWYLFYEIYKENGRKGVIGYSESYDGEHWNYGQVILEEEYHLSYPYVIRDNDDIYMIPEGANGGSIKLYKAKNFPVSWEMKKEIIYGSYWDPSVFYYDGIWWMFALTNKPEKFSLALFYSDSLEGEWKEHPKSPIIINNPKITRPAGRVFNCDKLIRYTQDCSDNYGKLVKAFEIVKLTKTDYKEKEIGVIIENSKKEGSWNKDGMHNIDIEKFDDDNYIIAVDGYYYKKTNKVISKIKNFIYKVVK